MSSGCLGFLQHVVSVYCKQVIVSEMATNQPKSNPQKTSLFLLLHLFCDALLDCFRAIPTDFYIRLLHEWSAGGIFASFSMSEVFWRCRALAQVFTRM